MALATFSVFLLIPLSLFASAFAVWILLQALAPLLQHWLLDQPNARSAHHRPTPRGGGLAFVLMALVVSGLTLLIQRASPQILLPIVAMPLAMIGLLDDRLDIPVLWRYGVQLATALAMLLLSPLFAGLNSLVWLVGPALLIAVTAVINFTNFMDGLDGLVAGCMAVALAAVALSLRAPAPIWALVGGLLGFLIWNWSPARVFMGDVGSTYLGAMFAALVLQSTTWHQALSLLLVATPLLGDACVCVPRRLIAGQSVFQAHRLHLFQRLHQSGWSHSKVSCTYIGSTAVLSLALIWGGLLWVFMFSLLVLLIGIWLDQRVAVPFDTASLH